jgi:radical SAM superfamily enzyme YgiQ (UPF0313 family)
MRTWQMEPLPAAVIAGLTPGDVDVRFYDDRMQRIPFDEPTDAVALSVETYTARRSYQIASEYRRRGVPVVMGGFHATLCTDEVTRYADATVVGEAEGLWPEVVDDIRHATLKRVYRREARADLKGLAPDRSIFSGKRYLPIALVELGRGCRFACEFCSVQAMFRSSHVSRPVEEVVDEVRAASRGRRLVFFVDDNFAADRDVAKEFLRRLVPFGIRWVGQLSIDAARDEELLELMARSACQCVLIGLESLDPVNLRTMNKSANIVAGGYDGALRRLRRHRIPVYGTFLHGYGEDTRGSIARSLEFAMRNGLFIAAFNHSTPFPGTPFHARLRDEHRLTRSDWWLDESYGYGSIPFTPKGMNADELERACIAARRAFYSPRSIAHRMLARANRSRALLMALFLASNVLHRLDIRQREHHPLGDQGWDGTLLTTG